MGKVLLKYFIIKIFQLFPSYLNFISLNIGHLIVFNFNSSHLVTQLRVESNPAASLYYWVSFPLSCAGQETSEEKQPKYNCCKLTCKCTNSDQKVKQEIIEDEFMGKSKFLPIFL